MQKTNTSKNETALACSSHTHAANASFIAINKCNKKSEARNRLKLAKGVVSSVLVPAAVVRLVQPAKARSAAAAVVVTLPSRELAHNMMVGGGVGGGVG